MKGEGNGKGEDGEKDVCVRECVRVRMCVDLKGDAARVCAFVCVCARACVCVCVCVCVWTCLRDRVLGLGLGSRVRLRVKG